MPPTPPSKPARSPSPPAEAPKPAGARPRWRVIPRRHRVGPQPISLPTYEPTTPWFIEHAPPELRYPHPEGHERPSREARREHARQRFERFRAHPFASWVEDPGFFWQLALLILLTLALLLFLVLAWNNPPQRYR